MAGCRGLIIVGMWRKKWRERSKNLEERKLKLGRQRLIICKGEERRKRWRQFVNLEENDKEIEGITSGMEIEWKGDNWA